eukprot:CAMPEP_0198277440 /NCGR_PEP_ID=MMETSP1447-20131203/65850_1 /TAXON_ID=420782 /ORGANISM="Chaetoceros dichaeta, Strain CCMP1751" /LENGTH=337 /DNA_ID=CAMNT_0043972459 /DNA_START=162 /DNA_END=1172 /DNA_ORIENTATION=-
MTAHDALQNFAHAATHNRSDNAASTAAGFGGAGGGGGGTMKKNRKYNKDKDTTTNGFEKGLPHIIDPKWIELQAHLNEDEDGGGGGGGSSSSTSTFQTILPPRSRMDFYGSTEVGVLLLRPYRQIHHPQQQPPHHPTQQRIGGGLYPTSPQQQQQQQQPQTPPSTSQPPTKKPVSSEQYSDTELDPTLRPYRQIHHPQQQPHHPTQQRIGGGLYPTSPSPHQQPQPQTPPSTSTSQPQPPPKQPVSSEQYSDTELDATTLSESLVYAISPENTFGLSMREMNTDNEDHGTTSGGTWSTVKIGVLEVSLASRHEGVFVDETEEEEMEMEDANGRGGGG